MFVFIDESGNFSRNDKPYFIIGGFLTSDPKRTSKIFRKWQHNKFPKKLRRKNEVKFTDTGLCEELRLKTIDYLSKQDIRIFYTYLDKSNIPLEYYQKKGLESGWLYAEIVAHTLELLLPTNDPEFRVFRDKRHLKRLPQSKFNEILKTKMLPVLPSGSLFQIQDMDSSATANIQIADWVCGALFRYYNKGRNGKEFFLLLKNNIVNSEELFKNYWENKKSR